MIATKTGTPPLGRRDHVFAVVDGGLDEGQKGGGDQAAHDRRYHPAGGDLGHGEPVDGIQPGSGHSGPHDAADDGVSGRDRGAEVRGEVEPQRGRQERRHHRADEGIGARHHGRVDDLVLNRRNHVAARQDSAGGLENYRDEESPDERQGPRADGRSDVVGDVIGADVERHIATDDAGADNEGRILGDREKGNVVIADCGDHPNRRQEEDPQPNLDDLLTCFGRRLFEADDLFQILVEGCLFLNFGEFHSLSLGAPSRPEH